MLGATFCSQDQLDCMGWMRSSRYLIFMFLNLPSSSKMPTACKSAVGWGKAPLLHRSSWPCLAGPGVTGTVLTGLRYLTVR